MIVESAKAPKRRVERARRMALRKEELVFFTEVFMKYDHHGVQGGEVPAYVADAAFKVHLEQSLPRNAYIVRVE
jgi:hypothetical protein